MNLNINQKYDIENPGIRWVEWTDAIKMKKSEPSGAFKEHWLVMHVSEIHFNFLFK